MPQRFLVEWGGSKVFVFTTQAKQVNSDQFENIQPDIVKAYIETAEKQPRRVAPMPVQQVDTGKYYVAFKAEKDVVEPGKAYYLAFYWTYRGLEMVERILVVVVPDAPAIITDK